MRILCASFVPAMVLAGCGGSGKPPAEPEKIVEEDTKPKPPPPPPPVCVLTGAELSLIGMVEAEPNAVRFCVSDGAEATQCYGVDVGAKKYAELDSPPRGASPVLDATPARVETTPKEVKVCVGEECKTFKPKVPRSDNPIDAVTNGAGTHAAVLMGDSEKGRGTVEVWDVKKNKRLGVPLKYAKGDYKCGEARMLGQTLYVSASVCSGPAARAWLFTPKGKKIADVGGKDFGTYGTVPVQLTETQWAFLDENASAIAIQDVVSGDVVKTIDIAALWGGAAAAEGDADAPPPAMGNPGESALVRAGDGQLVVVTGGPTPGHVGLVDVEAGTLGEVVTALQCAPTGGGSGDGDGDGDEAAAEE